MNRFKFIITSILIILFLFCFFPRVKAEGKNEAGLYFSPASNTFIKYENFSVEVMLDSQGSAINACGMIIHFPSDKLEVLKIAKNDSIFSFWAEEPVFSNSSGEISFSAGLPSPGFLGKGNIIKIDFKAKETGSAGLHFGEAKILANDGKGTDILSFVKEAKYFVSDFLFLENEDGKALLNSAVFSFTHPDQDQWYNNNNPYFEWNLSSDITGVSFILDRDPDTLPDDISEGLIGSKKYEDIKNGIWYFHLKLSDKSGWGEPSHYRVQVDVEPPSFLDLFIDNNGDLTNPNLDIYLEAEDDISGIDYYKFKMEDRDFLNLMLSQVNPFSLSDLFPGKHQITVRAADKAGNNVEIKSEIEIEPIETPQIHILPEIYVSGEEILYLEGTAPVESEVIIFLKKGNEVVKEWKTSSNSKGEWFFSTRDLIKSNDYYLSVQARDKRGALSGVSEDYRIKAVLSGFSIGDLIISFKNLILILLAVLILGILIGLYFIFRTAIAKKSLKREIEEAKQMVSKSFMKLKKDLEMKIEMLDSKPGLSKKERRIYDDLKNTLDISEAGINKEIEDVERELS